MTRKEIKALAKEKLKGNWGVVICSLILSSIMMGAASAFAGILELVVMGPIAVGLCCVLLNVLRKGKADIEDLFHGFSNNFFNNFITGLLVGIFTFLWSLLFIIPGIIKKYSYAMAMFIQYDNPNMSETDAITASRKMMKGHKGELFVLDLSFFGWYLLSILTFGLLLLYVAPYHHAAKAAFYENLKAAQEGTKEEVVEATGSEAAQEEVPAIEEAKEEVVEEEAPAAEEEAKPEEEE